MGTKKKSGEDISIKDAMTNHASQEFEQAFKNLTTVLGKRPNSSDEDSLSMLRQLYYEGATQSLNDAKSAYEQESIEAAWSHLVNAAHKVGCIAGIDSAQYHNASEQGLVALLEKNGRLGGLQNGKTFAELRDQAAAKLIAAAPNGKWPTLAEFQLEYHQIVAGVAGFSDTEHQRRLIMKRKDVLATLPPAVRGRR